MPKVICFHCEREYEGVQRDDRKYPPCPGCEELGHHGPSPDNCPACRADKRAAGQPIVEEKRTKGGHNPPNKSKRRPPAPGGSGGKSDTAPAAGPDRKTALISTLQGLAVIADEPYGQQAAENLLLSYIGDPDVTAAYQPFAKKAP